MIHSVVVGVLALLCLSHVIYCQFTPSPPTGNSYCNSGPCSSDYDCDLGYCCGGICVEFPPNKIPSGGACNNTDSCSYCENGFCQGGVCRNYNISTPTSVERRGQKGCSCSSDLDCDYGFVCVNGACDFKNVGLNGVCQEDKQCSSLKCIGGLCKAGVTEGQNCSFSFSSSLCDVSSSGVWSRCLFNTTTFTNTCQRLLSPNDVCSTYENLCPPWYFCAPDNATSSMGHCRMMYSLREGETCYSTRQCSSTLYCNNAGSAQYFGVCTSLPSQPPLCHQYCPAQSAGLQRCQCGGVNNQQAVCVSPSPIPNCDSQSAALANCGYSNRCPDLWTEYFSFSINENFCLMQHCRNELLAFQCCQCPLKTYSFIIQGSDCSGGSPTYRTPNCCSSQRQSGNCPTDSLYGCIVVTPSGISPTTTTSSSSGGGTSAASQSSSLLFVGENFWRFIIGLALGLCLQLAILQSIF